MEKRFENVSYINQTYFGNQNHNFLLQWHSSFATSFEGHPSKTSNWKTRKHLAPSIHSEIGISILKRNVKMALEMSGLFNWLPLLQICALPLLLSWSPFLQLFPYRQLKFFLGKIYHLSKMSHQGTIVPGRLRSELFLWGVNFYFI